MTRPIIWGLSVLATTLCLIVAITAYGTHRLLESAPHPLEPTVKNFSAPVTTTPLRERLQSTQTQSGQEKRLILTQEDLNHLCRAAIRRRRLQGDCSIAFSQDRIQGAASLKIEGRWLHRYLNIDLTVDETARGAVIETLKIGGMELSAPAAGLFLKGLAITPPLHRYGILFDQMLKDIHIEGGRLVIRIKWNRELLTELRDIIEDTADKGALLAYQNVLTTLLNDGTERRFVRLSDLMQPVFQAALVRSQQGHDPVSENRAAIMVLSAYGNGKDLTKIVGTDAGPKRRNVLLNKRVDTAKHFLAAALLAMSGQGTLVEIVSLIKEMHDTHDGSGFSFIDLAADESGAAFGKLAVSSQEAALHVQRMLSEGSEEAQFIPPLKDLPESMHSEEFAARFKIFGSPEFLALRDEIDARIRALPLFRPTTNNKPTALKCL
ncbi:MAG: hypothetical protein D4R76_02145 [Methylococcus sp.]|nr:MAG: hypothetical protein D4R76_02145 [Methylococcus sp.]